MDAFKLRDRVVADYSDYIQSFLNIADADIRAFVDEALASGLLWPDALLQLSPSYQTGHTVDDLVGMSVLHPLCGELFRLGDRSLPLHQHQIDAIEASRNGHNFVVTTGTGSGKSLTYLIPIINHVLRNRPEEGKVRAILVYPMNALINSQEQAIQRFIQNLRSTPSPIEVKRYTGQESSEVKAQIRANPPHILLTNYVMLELMLTRPGEDVLVDASATDIQYLVLDEMHTYRGRQGADVALLVRRLRERCGNPKLQCIGTSATMATGHTRAERNAAIADIATRIFGAPVDSSAVINETLRWGLQRAVNLTPASLRDALTEPLSNPLDWEALINNPLASWIESSFGLREDNDGRLRRRDPISLWQGAQHLSELTDLPVEHCASRLQELFQKGSEVRSPDGVPAFAFKLHQFFSQGGSVYATVELPPHRHLTLEGQHYAPGQDTRLLFPIVFCRECGQTYYLCNYDRRAGTITPRSPQARDDDAGDYSDGYLAIDPGGFWPDDHLDLLPETWLKQLKRGTEIKKEYAAFQPLRLFVLPNGSLAEQSDSSGLRSWFVPTPFLTCLRCGEVYTKRQRTDFGKLARLSSEGRSTATTLLTLSAVAQMRSDAALPTEARKLLSFTDNRQDASLQAGHFNDFVNVALLRAAIYRALEQHPTGLDHTNIAHFTVEQLNLEEASYAKEAGRFGPLARRNKIALQDLVEYRIYEDLRRGWRINQPNLEQCGLLFLDYDSLDEVCETDGAWKAHELLLATQAQLRKQIIRAILDYMRRELAISAPCLQPDHQDALLKRVREALREPWTFDENEQLYSATRFLPPGTLTASREERSLGSRTTIGRYLRSKHTWPMLTDNLDPREYNRLVEAIIDTLRGAGYLVAVPGVEGPAFQLRSDTLIWRPADGHLLGRDPIRSQRMNLSYDRIRSPNRFFASFYQQAAAQLAGVEGREHTGQVGQGDRETREKAFREGALAALFCSPTMELGIDIADLNTVHLRNVPPTPANYAQRSGRAGRSGQPAFVATYCAVGSGHDQYFFRRPSLMVSGAVVPPRIDLANEDLLRAHVHAVWLSYVNLDLAHSMIELIDTSERLGNYPLHSNIALALQLAPAHKEACSNSCQRLLASLFKESEQPSWHSEQWLQTVLDRAPMDFDQACNRWRELYSAAERQLHEARADIDRRYQTRGVNKEGDDARRREAEALRQKDLLCNGVGGSDTDFYPYRYFASEGFLPGYNFPRLPIQAYLNTGRQEGAFISRPRFLALTEFGPRNVIYHEGRKYRVTKTFLPGGNPNARMITAKLCNACGFFHEGVDAYALDFCQHCNAYLDADNSLTIDRLFEMTTVGTQRVESITSEEEERVRQGYEITTHYRFAPHVMGSRRTHATVHDSAGEPLIDLTYGPAATLWRINHRWRRANTSGYTLDLKRGTWAKKPGDEGDLAPDPDSDENMLRGVRIMVRDTRNILLLYPVAPADDEFLASLQYALQRGIETVFQVAEQELTSELIGRDNARRIMLWESAEGGVGVLGRLSDEPKALSQVAASALELCHFDPESGSEIQTEANDCSRACYRCLLSYSNQPSHALLNRHVIRDFLLSLSQGETAGLTSALLSEASESHDSYTSFDSAPVRSNDHFAARVLSHLEATERRLPSAIEPQLYEVELRPDFYYEAGAVCVFCEEKPPTADEISMRDQLLDAGYHVIILRADTDLETQLLRWSEIFGRGKA